MTLEEILSKVDHTLLSPTAVWEEIRQTCDEAIRFRTASVCIPPSFVDQAAEHCGGRIPICTVIGFPNGYSCTAIKQQEADLALKQGAREIDMVIHLGWVKAGRFDLVQKEIEALRAVCRSYEGGLLKVIVEACLLTQEEKTELCRVVTEAGADYIKTSTGFSTGGAAFEDVKLFARHIGPQVKIKAAGGIADLADAEQFLRLGASRLGTSRIVRIAKEQGGNT